MMAFGSSSSSMLLENEEGHENQEQDIHPKKRRNPKIPYPDAEIIALSPATLMAKNRFICEICLKGFPREQNLQLHKRGHNLPWKLKQSTPKDDVKRKAYVCPEPSCIHHNRAHSLGDLTGIKKHYSRKHGEKKYKCQKCVKMYAVESDLKAHTKTCGKKEYQCSCGTFFSRHDSFISHKALCEALTNGDLFKLPTTVTPTGVGPAISTQMSLGLPDFSTGVPSVQNHIRTSPAIESKLGRTSENNNVTGFNCYRPSPPLFVPSLDQQNRVKYQGNFDSRVFTNLTTTQHNMGSAAMMPQLSATALLHKASLLGSTWSNYNSDNNFARPYATSFSNVHMDGTNGRLGFRNFDRNGIESNIPNYLSNNEVGPSMLNLNASAPYEQEDSNHGGIDSRSGGYNDEWNMSFQQSKGATFTRDFLGVGGGINVSSDDPESSVVGRSSL
ncbi:putative transcription factor C2H2 family [Helianthus annuus]|nr:putative transcription factor C2H2 family [Helianthus annuus]